MLDDVQERLEKRSGEPLPCCPSFSAVVRQGSPLGVGAGPGSGESGLARRQSAASSRATLGMWTVEAGEKQSL